MFLLKVKDPSKEVIIGHPQAFDTVAGEWRRLTAEQQGAPFDPLRTLLRVGVHGPHLSSPCCAHMGISQHAREGLEATVDSALSP